MKIRAPAVAGAFYPSDPIELRQMIEEFIEPGAKKSPALGVMAPHAGYIYSGKGAGIVYSRVEIPKYVVVLAPNHRGIGADVALWSEGKWLTPLGEIPVAEELCGLILEECSLVEEDERAHRSEHSLEVQLPFLQYFRPDFELVPFCLLRMSYQECEELGRGLARAIKRWAKPVLVVASSDMSHYISAEEAERKDKLALERMINLDPEGLYQVVYQHNISMCGFIPATVMLVSALELGASQAELVDYRNSGDVTGDYREVVAYASVMVR